MIDSNKIRDLDELLDKFGNPIGEERIKRIKSDKGLIERTESSKIILTEDNRQVLTD